MVLALKSLSFLFLFSTAFAAVAPPQATTVEQLRNEAVSRKKEIAVLTTKIKNLENSLNQANKKFLSTVKVRKDIEESLSLVEKRLHQGQAEIQNLQNEINKRMKIAVVNSLGGQLNAKDMMAHKFIMISLQSQLKELETVEKSNLKQQLELQSQQEKLTEYVTLENDLGQLLGDLEIKKSDAAKSYLVERETLEKIQLKLAATQATQKIKKQHSKLSSSLLAIYAPPIEEFLSVEYKKKGVTFSYSGKKPVLATQKGRILFTGSLSTYGNVVMIDHGDETRSVILGQFTPKVEKGMIVSTSDVLGYTQEESSGKGKIYFELRQKNKVQNTFPLLDSSKFAAHSLNQSKI